MKNGEILKDGEKIILSGKPCITYICDQQAQCKGGILCGTLCKHTTDINHAKNFKKLDDTRYEEKR